jgi:hypothetical protein
VGVLCVQWCLTPPGYDLAGDGQRGSLCGCAAALNALALALDCQTIVSHGDMGAIALLVVVVREQ